MQIVHYGNLSASTVLIQPVGDHDLEEMETELNEIRKQGKADFQLIAVKVDNWNQDLSPGRRLQSLAERASETVRGSCCNFF